MLCKYEELDVSNTQLVVLTLQLGAIKLLQKKRPQPDDVIKRQRVKPQTNENNVENMMAKYVFLVVSCINLGKVSLSLKIDLIFFSLYSRTEDSVGI